MHTFAAHARASCPGSASGARTRTVRCALAASALAVLFGSGASTFVDPDVWHLMALGRDTLASGRVPLDDRFAYTPTVHPFVQHEWGTGVLLYGLARLGGVPAFQVARAGLMAVLALATVAVARRRGASAAVLGILAPLAIVMSWIGLTAIRAQLVTLACLAIWLRLLEEDRAGRRRWMVPAVLLYVVWVNVHAGFVVALGCVVLHAGEQALRGRPIRHLLLLALAMLALVAVNPYGLAYYPYLWGALTLARDRIGEWRPVWEGSGSGLLTYAASVAIAGYGLARAGLRRADGWPLVLAAGLMAFRHERHVSIWAVVWLAHVPALVERTPTGAVLRRLWARDGAAVTVAWAGVLVLALTAFVEHRPWRLVVPAERTGVWSLPYPYPAGAVRHLAAERFRGNVMVPFEVGAFVSWKLDPRVRVSLDTRFETAYPVGLLDEALDFYDARPGWRATLDRYPTDLVLVRVGDPIGDVLRAETPWTVAYRDDVYELFARPGVALAHQDRRGSPLGATLP